MGNSETVMKSQRRKKLFAVEQFGGKCQICGYNRCVNALQFHHINPEDKLHAPSDVIFKQTWEVAFEELKKCILVCANCHAEIHYKELLLDSRQFILPVFEKHCKKCDKKFETKNPTSVFCGTLCSTQSHMKVKETPTEYHLRILIDRGYSWDRIGKEYGVSGNAMRKWGKKFNLINREIK